MIRNCKADATAIKREGLVAQERSRMRHNKAQESRRKNHKEQESMSKDNKEQESRMKDNREQESRRKDNRKQESRKKDSSEQWSKGECRDMTKTTGVIWAPPPGTSISRGWVGWSSSSLLTGSLL